MATVAFLLHPSRPESKALADRGTAWLQAHGHNARILTPNEGDTYLDHGDRRAVHELDLTDVALAVGLGGDGTLLRLVAHAVTAGVPILGVNVGRLGFLLDVMPEQLEEALEASLSGDVVLEERPTLAISVGRLGIGPWMALNEVVVERSAPGHTIRLDVEVGGSPFLGYSADGVILATPTGSTAYNLSAGGPVLSPRLAAVVLTPIAPHLSSDRSVVLDPSQEVVLRVREPQPGVLVVDGTEACELEPGDEVVIGVSEKPARFVAFGRRDFAATVRAALLPRSH